jgi:uncharacterized membrane protein
VARRPPGSLEVARDVLALPAALLAVGVVAALAVLALDHGLPSERLSAWVAFEPATARTMLATGAGAILSVAAFTFWMRMVVVQLVTSTFSPRLLAQFLEDGFQRIVMASMIGAFGFVVTVVRDVPADGTAADVPQLAVVVALLVVAGAAAGILVSIRVSVHTLDNGRLVHTIADGVSEVIDTVYPNRGDQHAVDPTPPDGPGRRVDAAESGWVATIDDQMLLDRLPPDTVVELHCRVGSFVVVDEPVATVWPVDVPDAVVATVGDAVVIQDTRSPDQDLEYGLRQLVDVGEQSLTSSAPDSGTANEVIGHLGAVLDHLISRDAPAPAHGDVEGRRIIRPLELSQEQLFRGAVAPLRQAGSGFPHVAKDLLRMLRGLRTRAVERDHDGHLAAIDREAALVVEGALAADTVLHADATEVRDAARSWGLPGGVEELDREAVGIPAVT